MVNFIRHGEIRKSGELLRIYSGRKVESWQFEIESRVNISSAADSDIG